MSGKTMTDKSLEQQPSGRVFWRSLESRQDPKGAAEQACGSDVVKRTIDADALLQLRRRSFLTLSGSIAALASVEGCIRRPAEKILPYSQAPEYAVPGVAFHYATVTEQRGEALGLLVTSHEGRPTKIEGNPEHPASLGASGLLAQASILDLYDPDRSRQPEQAGKPSTFEGFDAAFAKVIEAARATRGEGLRILAQSTNSPSFLRLREAVLGALPSARFHTYAPINESASREGARIAFGRPLVATSSYDKARVVVALDSDFLSTEAGSTLAARRFADGRRLRSAAENMNRLYAVEPVLSVTGSNADHRLRLAAGDVGRYARLLAAELASAHGISFGALGAALSGVASDGIPAKWIKSVAKDLAANRGASVLVAGSRQPAAVHALVAAMNAGLGNLGATVHYYEPSDPAEVDNFASVKVLAEDSAAGKVSTLLILGGNPVYDAPADLKFAEALSKIAMSVHLSSYADETSAKTTWQVPRAHELETWGDQRAVDGTLSVQQPLIAPLWGGRSDVELLALLAGEPNWRGYHVVRKTMSARGLAADLDWNRALQAGVVAGSASRPVTVELNGAGVAAAVGGSSQLASADGMEVVFLTDHKVFDGRHANNSWLLEMPDPLTRITWDNAAFFAPSTAKSMGLKNGDMVRITLGDQSVEIVAWALPGQAANTIGLPLGWGRTRAGRNGNGHGFDVYPLRTSTAPHIAAGAKVQKLGRTYPISQTQDHDSMEGRPVVIDADLAAYRNQPNFAEWRQPTPSVGPLWEKAFDGYVDGHKWGMTIDLTACNGCNACVVACQSENNVPVVGKDQVARGREMHWFRIDRYFVGDADEPEVAFQPIGCQHCEEAPCENVCPVNATAHSPEGLNDIAYNRCIGTRYCMNNCPYKVRRFNFLNFNLDIPETRQMQFNPNVSVRFRGVIEKCSYCVQRIQGGKIKAKAEARVLKDGDIKSACQQACPSRAITFGDLNDPNSEVAKASSIDRKYKLLADVGTAPRTTFLGKVRNVNPEMHDAQQTETHG